MNKSSITLLAVVGVMLVAIVILPSLAGSTPSSAVITPEPIVTPAVPSPSEEPVATNEPVQCQRATAAVCVYLEPQWVSAYETTSGKRWQYVETLIPGAVIPGFFESPSIIVLDASPFKKIKPALGMWKDALNTESGVAVFQDEMALETRVIGDNYTKVEVMLDLGLILSEDGNTVAAIRFAAVKLANSAVPPYIVQYSVPLNREEFEAKTENEKLRLIQDVKDSFDALLNTRLLYGGS